MTHHPAPSSSTPRRRWPRVVLLIAVVLACVYGICRYTLHRRVQAKLDEIRKAGYPVTLADFEAWYPEPPRGENGAEILLAAFSKYDLWTNSVVENGLRMDQTTAASSLWAFERSRPTRASQLPIIGSAKLPNRGEPIPGEMKQLMAEHLRDNKEALELLHHGASMVRCKYPLDLSEAPMPLLRHLWKVRLGAQLLQMEAIVHAENGEEHLAARSGLDSLRLADSLDREPIVQSLLVQIACREITVTSLERVMNRLTLAEAELVTLQTAFAKELNTERVVRSLAGERSLSLESFRNPQRFLRWLSSVDPDDESSGSPGFDCCVTLVYRHSGLSDLDCRKFLDLTDTALTAFKEPFPRQFTATKAASDQCDRGPRYLFVSSLFADHSNVSAIHAQHLAHARATVAALAVERYRQSRGDLPEKLLDVVPAYLQSVPTDPFDGKSIRYKKLSKGYVVYSIGTDGQDDGGREAAKPIPNPTTGKWTDRLAPNYVQTTPQSPTFKPTTDIVFVIER